MRSTQDYIWAFNDNLIDFQEYVITKSSNKLIRQSLHV